MQSTLPNIDILRSKFDESTWYYAQRLVDNGKVQLSFVKTREHAFEIYSGIVADNNTSYQTKISYRFPESEDGEKITTQCNCHLWSEITSCPHVAALSIKFQKSHHQERTPQGLSLRHLSLGDAANVEFFGSIIKNASQLINGKLNSTFSSLDYELINKKVIPFPIIQTWRGKLFINILPSSQAPDSLKLISSDQDSYLKFSYSDESDVWHEEISIFDQFYLFNWKTGQALELNSELKDLIGKLKIRDQFQNIQEWIRFLLPMAQDKKISLLINNQTWESIPEQELSYRFTIDESSRKGFLDVNLIFFTPDKKLTNIPYPFLIFASDQGLGDSFRTRNDAIRFYQSLIEEFETETFQYKKHLHSSSKKHLINEWIDLIKSQTELHFYDEDLNIFLILQTSFIKKISQTIMQAFEENSYRTVFAFHKEKKITWQIPKTTVLNGINTLFLTMNKIGIEVLFENKPLKNWRSNIKFERNLEKLDWFELDLIVSDVDLEIIKNANINDNYIVTDKGLYLLNDEQKDILRFMKRYTQADSKNKGKDESGSNRFGLFLNRARIFELFELKRLNIDGALTQDEEEFCNKIQTLEHLPQYELDKRFVDIARPYQVTGYQWLRFLYEHQFGACLADDMGLGKTIQAIMLLQSLKHKIKKTLIICPVSILYNWKNEIEKFSDLDFSIYYGDGRSLDTTKSIILTSYGLMKKESESTFQDIEFDVIIFDEVQHLKNIKSIGAFAARKIKSKFKICLTGTPVENDISEFYNIMDLCVPGIWGELGMLRTNSQMKNRLIARKTVKPFILRRTKEQVLKELPEKIEHQVYLEFNEDESHQYQAKLNQIRQNVLAGGKNRFGEVLKYLLELRQMCLWQKIPSFMSTKIDFLVENLTQLVEENHKTIVFSQFTTYLDFIENRLKTHGLRIARIDGSQSLKKRNEQVEKFQEGDAQVFLISLKAGGFGLNLTAASYVFLMDPWWNPAVERQAVDRAHRIGQENKLTVYRPIIKDSVEEKVLKLQESKKELFKDLMAEDDESYFSGKLSMEDFKHLIS